MSKKQNTEIATTQSTAMQTQVSQPRGFEEFDPRDMIFPRLRLLQGLSKIVAKGNGKIGQFQNSLTEELIGDKIELVLLSQKNGAVYFRKPEGLVCKSDNGIVSTRGNECVKCPYNEYWAKFKDDGTPPACSGSKEFVALVRKGMTDSPQPIIVSFIKTSYPLGKKLISMARFTNKDLFATSYTIGSEVVENDKGIFAKMTVAKGSDLTPEEFKIAEEWYGIIKSVKDKLNIHDDSEVISDV